MKKIFKNPIYMFILGIALSLSIVGVYALNASEIEYKNDKSVEDAINDLYEISSTYKNLSTVSDFSASDLLLGKKAYNSDGILITGTSNKAYTEAEYQSYGTTQYNAGVNSVTPNTPNIYKYTQGDTDNFTSTYTATSHKVVEAICISAHSTSSSAYYANTAIASTGTVITENVSANYLGGTASNGTFNTLNKKYELDEGETITCTSSAYGWGTMLHIFIEY